MVLTTKGVFRFDPVTKEIYLTQVHPRVSVADVKKDVPWELKVADDLSETPRPTDEEIDFMRNFAPNMVMSRELMLELTLANMTRKMKK